jgi:ankyrin repeat protein
MRDHETILLRVSAKGFTELAQLLIDHGAQVNAKTTYLATPLMTACRDRNTPMVKLLLANKADVTIKDENGETALDHAKRADAQDIVALLQQAGAK